MKVLFVCSGNNKNFQISPFIKAQGDSIINQKVDVRYFSIMKKGLWGYMQETVRLRKYLRENRFDIIHAHYSLSAWCAVLAFSGTPIVLSLMGDDANGKYKSSGKRTYASYLLILSSFLIQFFVRRIICKSVYMQRIVLNKNKSVIIPNGVNLQEVQCCDKRQQRQLLGLKEDAIYILFLGNTKDINKNFQLIDQAFDLIKSENTCLLTPYPIKHDKVIQYMSAADVVAVVSFMEGSPNVVKEAMACNTSIVATNVGDIKWLFGEEKGYYITDFTVEGCANKLKEAINYSVSQGKTNGRQRIVDLGLDSVSVAERIISLYKEL